MPLETIARVLGRYCERSEQVLLGLPVGLLRGFEIDSGKE